jgi:16S rRNA (guanine966-N2)-methyltransferase
LSDVLRIVAGKYKQRLIKAPKGNGTRPTSSKVREAIFSILLSKIPDANVLDLFAGSGALSFEAISRGAQKAVLCDNSRSAVAVIKENIAYLDAGKQAQVLAMPWQKALLQLSKENQKFDLVFLDPPYAFDLTPVLKNILDNSVLEKNAIICAEHTKPLILPSGLYVYKNKRYGQTYVTFIMEDSLD